MTMSDPFLTATFQHKAWANQRLIGALRGAPADVDRGQMVLALFTFDHTSIVDRIFKARLLGEAPAFEGVIATRMPDLDEMSATMAETDAWYIDYVSAVSPAELETVVDFTFVDNGDPGRMTKAQMLAHVITHSASHRGAIGKMLGEMKVEGASDMVTTFAGMG